LIVKRLNLFLGEIYSDYGTVTKRPVPFVHMNTLRDELKDSEIELHVDEQNKQKVLTYDRKGKMTEHNRNSDVTYISKKA
jgi:hypothetical protein